MDELVTGDAVVLGLRPARLPTRVLAFAVDAVVVATAYVVVVIALVLGTGSLDAAAVAALQVAAVLLILVGGPIAVETLSRGRSLGKVACGLRVVRDDGGPIRFRHALVRGAVGAVELLASFGVIACVASLVSARGRRIGDVFAGTLVVRERTPAARFEPVPPPPAALAGAFSGLDLSSVPDGLWLAVRQYLTRMGQLDAAVSWSVAARLANDVSSRTGAPAPVGVPPAAYLAAVLQERQVRDARRAFGGGDAASGMAPGAAPGAFPSPGAAAPAAAPAATPGAAADRAVGTSSGPSAPAPPPATGFVPPA
ncbi:RDD family protein [Streptomyces montanisoli]|uniref:RDD family protein n=1 Tax=Streptomyces montanisoli TaxID=2798581 RepID=A0A940MKL7_9ACTN|nr:RDD family protein [Streptomyces montanisoli]MBP0461071.1 RDD family protein [Streptomyces montanisoli]